MSINKQKFSGVKGMNDLLPKDSSRWEQLEQIVRDCLQSYGYQNIRTPILETTPVFTRGIGDYTDIVEKEMYSFTDALNGEPLTLRPEFTAGIVRATIEHNLIYDRPHRVYSMGPVFRHERPQRGRYRQFHQIDVEALGFAGPDVDAELIAMAARLWRILGLKDVRLELNSLGLVDERQAHRTALIAYLEQHQSILDEDGKRRLYTNPLRVLDTKNPTLQEMANNAPKLFDFLGEESLTHFEGVKARLDALGISYTINPRLVRGLDYYNLTVFEWVTESLGAQGTICGGGRYDGLFELLGGKSNTAVGFGIGMERLLELWVQSDELAQKPECDVYVAYQGEAASLKGFALAEELRHVGLDVILHSGPTSFKAQLKRADGSGASFAVILGESELQGGFATVKSLREGMGDLEGLQRQIKLDTLATTLVTDLVSLNEI